AKRPPGARAGRKGRRRPGAAGRRARLRSGRVPARHACRHAPEAERPARAAGAATRAFQHGGGHAPRGGRRRVRRARRCRRLGRRRGGPAAVRRRHGLRAGRRRARHRAQPAARAMARRRRTGPARPAGRAGPPRGAVVPGRMPRTWHPLRADRARQGLWLAGPGAGAQGQGPHLAGAETGRHGVLAGARARRRRRRPAGAAAADGGQALMKWVYLGIAIVAEIIATSALKSAEGFTRLLPSAIAVAGYAVAVSFLVLTLGEIPVVIDYAIWSGVGIVLISLVGGLFFKQHLDGPAIMGIALIIAGVV